MTHETRSLGGEVRAATAEDGRHYVTLHAISPGVVDTYGSLWEPDAFDESLARRLPTLVWSHNWADPIGHGLDYQTGPDGPTVRFAFDDFDAVPRARQAFVQTESGTIRDCSVGFSDVTRRDPTEQERIDYPGVREVITRATMDELSLVLAGAVPGAKVVSVRAANADAPVSREAVAQIMARLATGEMTLTGALNALDTLPDAADDPDVEETPPPATQTPDEPEDTTDDDPELDDAVDALMTEAAEALATAGLD